MTASRGPGRVDVALWLGPVYGSARGRVTVRDPAATVADLAERLGAGFTWLAVDGAPQAPTTPLTAAGIRPGALVAVPPGVATPTEEPDRGPYLVAETGLDGGRVFPLEMGSLLAGRHDRHPVHLPYDRSASRDHCRLDVGADGSVVVTDLGSRNGTRVNDQPVTEPVRLSPGDRVTVGSTTLRFQVGTGGAVGTRHTGLDADVFRRPPRRLTVEPPGPVPIPEPPDARAPKPTLPIVAFITPLVFSLVMIYALHNAIYALFGLLSPIAAVGTYLDGRRRYTKAKRGEGRDAGTALDRFAVELEAQRQATLERLHDTAGAVGALRQLAATASPALWERRATHPDFLEVRLATGHHRYRPLVAAGRAEPAAAAAAVIAEVAERGVDVASVALPGRWVGVFGDRPAALAVARSLLLQAATTSGPADLRVRLAVGESSWADWTWARWLPHAHTDADGSDGPGPGPATLWVVDGPGEEPGAAAAGGLALAEDFHGLPDRCRIIVHVDEHGVLSVEDLDDRSVTDQLLASGVAADVADAWARRLAGWRDGDTLPGHLPDDVNGLDLWGRHRAGPPDASDSGPRWPLGETRTGVYEVDLGGPDPHVVIAGAPGSGRTEALEGLVAALAGYGPDRVTVAVLDLAGGALAGLAALPHVAGVTAEIGSLNDHDGPVARLEAEVLRRDRLIRGAGFDSLGAYRSGTGVDVPYLVVAIDDPGTLSAEQSALLEALARVGATSAHLGIRVVLATTQPGGRAASVLKDSATRIALRLEARAAEGFVGVPYPGRLPRTRPGRAWVGAGDRPAVAVQLASTSAPAPPGGPVQVDLLDPLRPLDVLDPLRPLERRAAGPSVLDELRAQARHRFPEGAAPLWGGTVSTEDDAATATLGTLLGLGDLAALDVAAQWAPGPPEAFLRTPIGLSPGGSAVWLDLKEAAYGGMGPHGLIVGATGSGKSELLRTLVSGLALRHPPDLLSLVLVDFKGGATFAGFADLPHVAGNITNLESDLSNVDRMEAALLGEQQRRQELLRQAGNLDSAEAYRRVRATRPELPPMPEMLLIVDEFAELLEQRPEFINMFTSIGRLGRSLGIHLLLATQRLEEGRLRGLESHLRYRISLRTNSSAESRAVLGVPDAATLPSEPGVGYLRVDDPTLQRFRAALVSSPAGEAAQSDTTAPGGQSDPAAPGGQSDMARVVGRLTGAAPRTHQVWLPVLPARLALGRLLGRVGPVAGRGLQALDWDEPGSQRVPLGVIDRPRRQTRAVLVADFSGATGNLAVVGSPRSGKTTFLRTLSASLALTHTPEEVHLYALDFAGGGLLSLAGLPHVGAVAHQGDPELVGRTVGHVAAVIDEREKLFRELGVHSVDAFRRQRAAGRLPGSGHGDVYLLVDGWDTLRATAEPLEDRLADLARRGLAVGVHLVVAAGRWPVIRPALRDAVLGRLELRQSEPFESLFDRRAADNVPVGAPGRGLTDQSEHFLAAAPELDAGEDGDGAWAALVAAVAAAWSGPPAPPVRVLPAKVTVAELPPVASGWAMGLAEPDLGPFTLDPLNGDQHVLVLGDSGSGKSTFLRTFLHQCTAMSTPEQAKVLVADPRRGLMDAVPPGLQFGYAGSVPAAAAEISRLREAVERRLPGPEVTVAQLRERSWWSGPEAYLVVDDHDLLVTQMTNPLLPILDLLAQAADVGFHLVLARRVAGWQRAQYEPVIQRLREVGATIVLLSGDPSEGLITGAVRASARPPGRATLARYRQAPVTVQIASGD